MSPRLRKVVLAIVALGAFAVATSWVTRRLASYDRQLAELRASATAASSQAGGPRTPVVVYYANGAATPAGQSASAAHPGTPPAAPATAAPEAPPAEEVAPETARAQRIRRYEHIERIFAGQSPHLADPERAQAVRTAFDTHFGPLRAQLPADVRLGTLECRGRMCAAEVTFQDPRHVNTLAGAADQVAMAAARPTGEGPLVHLVTRPDATDETINVGRLFFEWLDPAATATR